MTEAAVALASVVVAAAAAAAVVAAVVVVVVVAGGRRPEDAVQEKMLNLIDWCDKRQGHQMYLQSSRTYRRVASCCAALSVLRDTIPVDKTNGQKPA